MDCTDVNIHSQHPRVLFFYFFDNVLSYLELDFFLHAVTDNWLSNPALPDDILKEAVPGNIRRAEHFLHVLRRLVQYLEGRLETDNVEKEGPVGFVASINTHAGIDQKTLKFCYDRLHSLMLTLEITDTDEFLHIQTICDFATLVGTYTRGFSIIIEPFDERMPHIPDPVLQVGFPSPSSPRIVFVLFLLSLFRFILPLGNDLYVSKLSVFCKWNGCLTPMLICTL